MSTSQVEATALLAAERVRALARLEILTDVHRGFVDASRDTNADDEHDPEGTTIAFERSQVDSMMRLALARLAEIDAAQARVDDATYGVCTVCGGRIPEGRLQARPTATTCVGCAAP